MTTKVNTLAQILEQTADKAIDLSRENGVAEAPIVAEGVTVVPISKVSIGLAGGGADVYSKGKEKNPAGSGVKIAKTPMSLLVIQDGQAKVVSAAASAEAKSAINVGAIFAQAKGIFARLKEKKKAKQEIPVEEAPTEE